MGGALMYGCSVTIVIYFIFSYFFTEMFRVETN